MTLLEEARKEINEVDKEIARLFVIRMKAVEKVIRYKIDNNLDILDESRETEVIENGVALIEDCELKPFYKEFLIDQMNISKKYQQSIAGKSHNKTPY